jgi:hypothetical protein
MHYVLKRAREVDPQGLRTPGIITKPDQLLNGSDSEKIFFSLARNQQVEFHLGWHVVRNLDAGDQDQDRNAVEAQFLAESNFRSLYGTNLGITHLRQRLSDGFQLLFQDATKGDYKHNFLADQSLFV